MIPPDHLATVNALRQQRPGQRTRIRQRQQRGDDLLFNDRPYRPRILPTVATATADAIVAAFLLMVSSTIVMSGTASAWTWKLRIQSHHHNQDILRSFRPWRQHKATTCDKSEDFVDDYKSMFPSKENIHFLPDVEKVWVLSDLHTDHAQNLQWIRDRMTCVENRGGEEGKKDLDDFGRNHVFTSKDLLVVAGDISHDLELLEETFRVLLRREKGRHLQENEATEADGENFSNHDSPHILFCAGNHEAWMSASDLTVNKSRQKHPAKHLKSNMSNNLDRSAYTDTVNSLDKLNEVYKLCHNLGVLTGCTLVGGDSSATINSNSKNDIHFQNPCQNPLWIVPLESWYDGSLNIPECEDLTQDFGKWPWVDFIKCRWPVSLFPENPVKLWRKIPSGLVDFFLERNRQSVLTAFHEEFSNFLEMKEQDQSRDKKSSVGVMTVSHFLPNRQCLPDWKDVSSDRFDRGQWLDHGGGGVSAKFALVAGTDRLDEQIRRDILPPSLVNGTNLNVRQIHVFGHSHRPKDFELDGIRYIHNPLAKPREREICMVNPDVDFQLVWDTTTPKRREGGETSVGGGEIPGETIVRYWEEQGGGVEMLRQRMKKTRRRTRYAFTKSSLDATNSPVTFRGGTSGAGSPEEPDASPSESPITSSSSSSSSKHSDDYVAGRTPRRHPDRSN